MSRSRGKHKQERKRRHNRQIEEGTRNRTPRKKPETKYTKLVKLSELDPNMVKQVLERIKNMDL